MNTQDRELLELAAKAADIRLEWVGASPVEIFSRWSGDPDDYPETDCGEWNPLTDDGDALRLAAALRLQILPGKHYGDGCSVNPTSHPTPGVTSFVESKDMAEQMRRGITWAAAEIGRSM